MPVINSKTKKAFTLAELMVILAVMTVVIAAIAPILTSRHNTLMTNEVWHEVSADDEGDIYADGTNHFMLQEVMIGLSPIDLLDVKTNYLPYAKLFIRSSDRVNGNVVQKPIEFYYDGNKQGYLVAGRENIMLGGEYPNLMPEASRNSAYGKKALNSIQSGMGNTAVGYNALSSLTTGNYNTAIGAMAGTSTNGTGSVYIGHRADANGDYNTIISNNNNGAASNYTTAIGEKASFAGNYNVALGTYADASGNYNTVVGAYSMSRFNLSENKTSNRQYNTAIGAMSCMNIGANGSYKTCIGQGGSSTSLDGVGSSALSSNVPQVFIGRGNQLYRSPAAVVVNGPTTKTGGLGDASVVVYGNLIVRGQTYMYGQSPFPAPSTPSAFNPPKGDALMGYTLYKEKSGNHKPYVGLDGSGAGVQVNGTDGYMHQVYGGKENCICTYSNSNSFVYLRDGASNAYTSPGLQAYDWSADFGWANSFVNIETAYGYYYTGDSGSPNVELNRAHGAYHYGGSGLSGSCCPILTVTGLQGAMSNEGIDQTSDGRLKNVADKYSAGLNELKKLNFYNFTFKSDKTNTPWVGVMAQDLKTVFPNSVTKNENGYYKIRWDEMFYAAINAVKELNTKITNLIARVQYDFERIAKLKQENKKLENKIIKLADELEKLEQGK